MNNKTPETSSAATASVTPLHPELAAAPVKTKRTRTTASAKPRQAAQGDTAPVLTADAVNQHVPKEATQAAQGKQLAQVLGLLDNTELPTPERAAALPALHRLRRLRSP